MLQKQKGFIHIIGILILLAGLAASLYLVKNPTIFRPKAADERTRIEFVDAAGNLITQTNTQQVRLKLTYVPPPVPTPSPVSFPGDFQDVTQATGFRFGAWDGSTCMDTAKI